MNYIGSKKSLLSFLERSIETVTGGKYDTFCDIFAGTGIVGSHFKKLGRKVVANDLQYYSYALNRHYIGNHREMAFTGLIGFVDGLENAALVERGELVCKHLTGLPLEKGFIYSNYSLGGTKGCEFERMYFSDTNAMRCDTIRTQLDKWKEAGALNEDEYFFLLASLLEVVDKHANTASVYGAFLKKIKKSAQRDFELLPAELILNDNDHIVLNEDVNSAAGKISVDVLYMDPPYNQRQYAPNYHLLETIARNDSPKIKGKTGLRDYSSQKSDFCTKSKVKDAFKRMILEADAKYMFLSYNNEGLMTLDEIEEIMSLRGEYGCFTQRYNRFKADNGRDYLADKTVEYLHYVVCNN